MTIVTDTRLSTAHDLGPASSEAGFEPRASDFFALLKPRVMSLVVFTGLVGIVLAPGGIHPFIGFTALLCIAVGAGASGALNMWYDADIDARMSRTLSRPIPSGRLTPDDALAFGLILSAASVLTMGLLVNLLAAALLAFTIFFYAVVYTMVLKRRTPQNIVIGGLSGALPPVIGWAAVTNAVSIESLSLCALIFFWTPPHFWALSLVKAADYGAVGVPMMPNVAGPESTRRQIVAYAVLLAPLGLAPVLLGFAGMVYGVAAAVLGLVFLGLAVRLYVKRDNRAAMQLFAFSILYLFLLFALLLVERLAGLA
ncbi:heme o synthase [Zavarzinia compransoris]|uniref:Protoheme IX farnesyltransferase n=1 Tax=Zavarzinia compransoris TaxID=1264899 RepID=A0A317DZJ7_9PROT|nr:heme o synthase [Zavarzinia compransoris]PWR19851.1 protoheme IX farnesyltransferase [Zavarzinia compransoris]TDP45039.1 protoheme IX farnesyltransferase [Zavarzinia compransoris]